MRIIEQMPHENARLSFRKKIVVFIAKFDTRLTNIFCRKKKRFFTYEIDRMYCLKVLIKIWDLDALAQSKNKTVTRTKDKFREYVCLAWFAVANQLCELRDSLS